MRVILLFDVDPDMPDPERGHPEGVHTYEYIPRDADVIVLWRERGESFKGGYRDHAFVQGVFENIGRKHINRIIRAATSL